MKLVNICTNCQSLTFHDATFNSETKVVFSYGTPVLAWRSNQYHRLWSGWSATTSRHISKAIGRSIPKKEWEAMEVEDSSNFIC